MEHVVKDASELSNFPKPSWMDLSYGGKIQAGKILLSYQIVTEPFFEATNLRLTKQLLNINVGKSLHYVKMTILGLRSLKPMGMLPIKRAEVHFNVSSIRDNLTQSLEDLNEIVVIAKNRGPDPFVGSVLNFSCQLPLLLAHVPSLSCGVYD